MINRLLCKMNIHKYVLKADFKYYYARELDGYNDITYKRLDTKKSKIIIKCYWCGKIKEDSYE